MSADVPLLQGSDLEALMRIPSSVSDGLLAAIEAVRLKPEIQKRIDARGSRRSTTASRAVRAQVRLDTVETATCG